MPVRWVDDWPMLGDENGRVPASGIIPLKSDDKGQEIVSNDDFSGKKLNINWQWNHNPVNNAWSLKARKGFLRLTTSRVVDNLYAAPNTLTQRMEGPKCSGMAGLDLSKMKDGDVAGLSAFNGNSGILAISAEGNKKFLTLSTNRINFDDQHAIHNVEKVEKARIELTSNIVYLRIDANFNLDKDLAIFYYSTDNKTWKPFSEPFKMIFDYTRLFMGTKFAIFNYATKTTGGYVDVDFFEYHKAE